jgi:hypothetical protein
MGIATAMPIENAKDGTAIMVMKVTKVRITSANRPEFIAITYVILFRNA